MTDVPHTPPATLKRARQQALAAGLRYVYTGNILDSEGGSTACANCGERLIGRIGYQITAYNLDDEGRCRDCDHPLPGRFH